MTRRARTAAIESKAALQRQRCSPTMPRLVSGLCRKFLRQVSGWLDETPKARASFCRGAFSAMASPGHASPATRARAPVSSRSSKGSRIHRKAKRDGRLQAELLELVEESPWGYSVRFDDDGVWLKAIDEGCDDEVMAWDYSDDDLLEKKIHDALARTHQTLKHRTGVSAICHTSHMSHLPYVTLPHFDLIKVAPTCETRILSRWRPESEISRTKT